MKKLYLAAALILAGTVFLMSGCTITMSNEQVFAEFKQALTLSRQAEIYYWQEDIKRDTKISRKMNVVCEQNTQGEYLRDESGDFLGYCCRLVESVDDRRTKLYQVGESFPQAGGNQSIPYAFSTKYNSAGEEIGWVREAMTADAFLSKDYVSDYTLQSKLYDLSLLEIDDIDFTAEDTEFEKKGYLTSLRFAIKPAFFHEYKMKFGKSSVLEGEQIYIEIIYGKIYNVVTYQNIQLDESMSVLEEDYSLKITYMGPKEEIPHYDAVKDNHPLWQEGIITG